MKGFPVACGCMLLSAAFLKAGEADLSKLDPAAIDKWIGDSLKAANLMAPAGPGPTEQELRTLHGVITAFIGPRKRPNEARDDERAAALALSARQRKS